MSVLHTSHRLLRLINLVIPMTATAGIKPCFGFAAATIINIVFNQKLTIGVAAVIDEFSFVLFITDVTLRQHHECRFSLARFFKNGFEKIL